MKNLTIKDSPELESIAMQFNRSKEEIIEMILNYAKKNKVISDDYEYAGLNIYDEFVYMDVEPIKNIFGTYYSDLEKLFKTLVFWGKKNECPTCGCELAYDGDYSPVNPQDGTVVTFWEKGYCRNPVCEYKIKII